MGLLWKEFLDQFRGHRHSGDDGSILVYEAATNLRKRVHIWLRIDDLAVLMRQNHKMHVMTELPVDEISVISLQAVDAGGNIVANLADIEWSNSNDDVVKAAFDGAGIVLEPIDDAVGKNTTVHVSIVIDGTGFSASIGESIVAVDDMLDADRLRKRRRRHHRRRNRQKAMDNAAAG